MPVARIQEQVRARHAVRELACPGLVLVEPFVVLHGMDLDGNAVRPRSELGRCEGAVEEEGSCGPWTGLRQHLGRPRAQREATVDQRVRQAFGDLAASVLERTEPDLPSIRDPLVEAGKGLSLVQVRRVDLVPRRAEIISKFADAGRQALGVMKQQDFGHT